MGIPRFFGTLIKKYPDIVFFEQGQRIDNLYFDFNGLLHPAIRGLIKQLNDEGKSIPQDRLERKFFKAVEAYTESVLAITKPQKLIYIAIDGVAPRSKMVQQRERRFKSVMEKGIKDAIKEEFDLQDTLAWDTNAITPGTQFMYNLSHHLKGYCKKLQDRLGVEVLLSTASYPSEGEHKIMDYIRQNTEASADELDPVNSSSNKKKTSNSNGNSNGKSNGDLIMSDSDDSDYEESTNNGNSDDSESEYDSDASLDEEVDESAVGADGGIVHAIYGLDADLIMLTMACGRRNIILVREVTEFKSYKSKNSSGTKVPFNYLSIDRLRVAFEGEFQELLEINGKQTCRLQDIITDFVFYSFLMGNDFLPHVPTLSLHNGGALDALMKKYKKIFRRLRRNLIRPKDLSIDYGFFRSLISDLARSEDYVFTMHHERRLVDLQKRKEKTFDTDYEQKIYDFENVVDKQEDIVRFHEPGCKERYYKYYCHFDGGGQENSSHPKVKSLCRDYIQGLNWVLQYYFKGCPDWNWTYRHHAAPFVSDLMVNMQNMNINMKFKVGKPYKPLEQLMFVLPPQSRALLPKCYGDLMVNEDSPLIKYYPETFEVDMINKNKFYECHAILDQVKPIDLMNAIRPVNKQLTALDRKRNKNQSDPYTDLK